jgi:quercetin dioxygenase-like cupin family protein
LGHELAEGFLTAPDVCGITAIDTEIYGEVIAMQVITISKIPPQEIDSTLFTGGQVTRQPLVTKDMGQNFDMSNVNFSPGSRNKFHSHSCDQVLLVTAGTGIVATEDCENVVTAGDLIHIPAGEKHWHGATKDSEFSHISLTQVGSTGQQLED